MLDEPTLTVKQVIAIILVAAIILGFAYTYLYGIKIGRTSCKIVGYTLFSGLNYAGLVSDAGLALFWVTCDKMNW